MCERLPRGLKRKKCDKDDSSKRHKGEDSNITATINTEVKVSANASAWVIRPMEKVNRVETLEDLIHIAWNYKEANGTFDWVKLWLLIPALTELKNMSGMDSLKSNVVSLVMYYLQHPRKEDKLTNMLPMHTIISGPPGCGKSQTAKILGKIYRGLDIISTDKVFTAKRDNFIGFAADKNAKEWIEKAKGGILYIDDSPSISSIEKGIDSFVSAMDILNSALPTIDPDLVCIIAGNETETEKYLFFVSSGIKTSFQWHFSIHIYSPAEMMGIFQVKTKQEGWKLDKGAISEEFFAKNITSFPAYGRDLSTLFIMCKIAHSDRTFISNSTSKVLTATDILFGFEKYKSTKIERKTTPSYFG